MAEEELVNPIETPRKRIPLRRKPQISQDESPMTGKMKPTPPTLAPHQVQLILTVLLVISVFFNGMAFANGFLPFKGLTGVKTTGTTGQNPPAGNPNSQFNPAGDVEKLRSNDHVRGNRNARILLIEYSDLECPFCKRFHPTAKKIVEEYKDKVAWVYRHYPIEQLHSKAPKEAEAVECANELGGADAFWKLTDKIYEVTPANNGLDLDELPKLAGQVGLNEAKFKTCLDSGKYKDYVQKDFDSGSKAGVTGTPGNILLDTKTGKTLLIPGALPFESFKSEIDKMLQS